MKRFALMLLALIMICTSALAGAPTSGAISTGKWAVVNNPDPADRLNLRSAPSREAESLGKYFNGVLVEVLNKADDGWTRVRVGHTEGYMMTKYLADPAQMTVAVEPVLPTATVENPFAESQGLLEKPDSADVTLMVTLKNGTEVTVLGLTQQRAHVQYCGVTGYIPLQSLNIEENQGANSVMVKTELPAGHLIRATLIRGDQIMQLLGKQELQALQEMMISTEYWGYKIAGCPFGATLTLEYADGQMKVMELATDSCPVVRIDGHDYYYARNMGKPGDRPDNSVLYGQFGME